jgi:hypothetical protein
MMRPPHRRVRARAAVLLAVTGCVASWPCSAKETEGPSLPAIQAAYDNAKSESGGDHVDGLTVRAADCQQDRSDAYSCQITFTATSGAQDRLYFDVIGLDRQPAGWKLVSGLCKRHD